MKKSSFIISVLAITTITGIIFAQAGGATTVLTIVEKMKAASHDFTLTTELNPGQTSLKSGTLSGKLTGGMVTAEEYNRILEMLGEGGNNGISGGGGNGSGQCDTWVYAPKVAPWGQPLTPAPSGLCRFKINIQGKILTYYGSINRNNHGTTNDTSDDQWFCATMVGGTINYNAAGQAGGTETFDGSGNQTIGNNSEGFEYCFGVRSGSGDSAGWTDVPLTDTNDFDTNCEYRIKQTLRTGGTDGYIYADSVWSKGILFEVSTRQFALGRIDASSKSKAYYTEDGDTDDVDGNRCTTISCANWTISGMQKHCGGTGGGSLALPTCAVGQSLVMGASGWQCSGPAVVNTAPCGNKDDVKSIAADGTITCRNDSIDPTKATGMQFLGACGQGGCGCMSGTYDWRCENVSYTRYGCGGGSYEAVCPVRFNYGTTTNIQTNTQCGSFTTGTSTSAKYCTW